MTTCPECGLTWPHKSGCYTCLERQLAQSKSRLAQAMAVVEEHRSLVAWCQDWADQTREAGSLRMRLRKLAALAALDQPATPVRVETGPREDAQPGQFFAGRIEQERVRR